MKLVGSTSRFHPEKCVGCKACAHVCPTKAYALPADDSSSGGAAPPDYHEEDCRGCSNCEQRCPAGAITIERLDRPFRVGVDPGEGDAREILRICTAAKMNPQQAVCCCTGTTAGEIAAAILKGAKTPEALSRMTGVRTGCTVLCIQSILRLLEAAGESVAPGATRQYYGRTATLWEIDEAILRKHEAKGYHFAEDRQVLKEAFQKKE